MDTSNEPLKISFDHAANYVRSLAAGDTVSQDKMLYFYARYKQATVGDCNTPCPNWFDFQRRQTWKAWNSLKGMSNTQAMEEYVEELTALDPEWESVEGISSKHGHWVNVSTIAHVDDSIEDSQKTAFDWLKEGNRTMVETMLNSGFDVNTKDDQGMALLHWASDRGHSDITELLLEHGADINLRDSDGQTALHFASACSHLPVVSLLLQSGVDVNAMDAEGCKAFDYASVEVKDVLSR